MNRLLPFVVTGTLIAAAVIVLLASVADDGSDVAFFTIEHGTLGNFQVGEHPPEMQVVRNLEEWERAWGDFTSNRDPAGSLPEVNFAEEIVILLLDNHASGGYSVEIEHVVEDDGALYVHARHTAPFPGSGVIAAITNPHHIIRLPRHEGDVSLVVTDVESPCPDEGRIWLRAANLVSEFRVHEIVESFDGEVLSRHGNSHIVTSSTGSQRFYTGKSSYSITVPDGRELELVEELEAFSEILAADWLCENVGTRNSASVGGDDE